MRPLSRRGGFMPVGTVRLYILVATVSLVMVALPIFKSIRDGHRREQAAHLRK